MNFMPITTALLPDEKAYRLVELNLTPFALSKGGRRFRPSNYSGLHRYQIVYVNRGDRLAQHITDMGDAAQFAGVGELQIVSPVWEDTVSQLRYAADRWRAYHAAALNARVLEIQAQSTLIRDAIRYAEERKRRRLHQTTSGPAVTVQR